jgi:hypothetical protein
MASPPLRNPQVGSRQSAKAFHARFFRHVSPVVPPQEYRNLLWCVNRKDGFCLSLFSSFDGLERRHEAGTNGLGVLAASADCNTMNIVAVCFSWPLFGILVTS